MQNFSLYQLTGTNVINNNEVVLLWLEAAQSRGRYFNASHKLILIHEYGEYGVPINVVAVAEWLLQKTETQRPCLIMTLKNKSLNPSGSQLMVDHEKWPAAWIPNIILPAITHAPNSPSLSRGTFPTILL